MKKAHYLILIGSILVVGTTLFYFGTKGKEKSNIEKGWWVAIKKHYHYLK